MKEIIQQLEAKRELARLGGGQKKDPVTAC
jgi:hypothetical protein